MGRDAMQMCDIYYIHMGRDAMQMCDIYYIHMGRDTVALLVVANVLQK